MKYIHVPTFNDWITKMKTILCFGDSNTWGCPPLTSLQNITRYGPDVRWGSVLRTTLGEGYWVIEEGLNGRTTVWADPVEGEYKSGKSYLTACLESHAPLDLVIMMLGTNDLKHRFGLSPWDIAASAGVLVQVVQGSNYGPKGEAPRVLLICPPPVGKLTLFAEMLEGAVEKSQQMARFYSAVAAEHHCDFLDAGQYIVSSDVDGIHLDPAQQQKLGRAVAEKVRAILAF
jgi:lysophospholipase L1-like esterase